MYVANSSGFNRAPVMSFDSSQRPLPLLAACVWWFGWVGFDANLLFFSFSFFFRAACWPCKKLNQHPISLLFLFIPFSFNCNCFNYIDFFFISSLIILLIAIFFINFLNLFVFFQFYPQTFNFISFFPKHLISVNFYVESSHDSFNCYLFCFAFFILFTRFHMCFYFCCVLLILLNKFSLYKRVNVLICEIKYLDPSLSFNFFTFYFSYY